MGRLAPPILGSASVPSDLDGPVSQRYDGLTEIQSRPLVNASFDPYLECFEIRLWMR